MDVRIEQAGYESNEPVIQDISFDVRAGEILGVIGSNGAGKTTTIACLTGTIPWMKGTVEMERYAYIPEQPVYYDYLTLSEHIALVQELTGVDSTEKTEELLQLFRLDHVTDRYLFFFKRDETEGDDFIGAHSRNACINCR